MEIQRYIRYALSLALTLVFLAHVSGFFHIPILTNLENSAYDLRLALTLPAKTERQVVIVDIDEKSLSELGQWPWNRNIMARINDTLFDYYQVSEVGFDIVFAEADIDEGAKLLESMATGELRDDQAFIDVYNKVIPTLQHDKLFADSLKNRKTVLGFVLETDTRKGALPEPVATLDKNMQGRIPINTAHGYTANLAILQESALRGGFFDNPLLDDDGVFRRVPLLQELDGNLYESLALALSRVYLGS
ncbi:MAG TPA: CHASE2 domain-containing protein, partial [Thiotrichales bacterium]|nr:CHASE2 domain-containing protein [Thiotrichales bacterium]